MNKKLFLIEKPSIVNLLLENIGTKDDFYISIPSIEGYVFRTKRLMNLLKKKCWKYKKVCVLKKRRLFLIEKPGVVSLLLENCSGNDEDFYVCIPTIAGYKFTEVREVEDLKSSDYSYVDEPNYYYEKIKENVRDGNIQSLMQKIQLEKNKNKLKMLRSILIKEMNLFEEVLFVVEPNYSGVRAIDLFLINVVGRENILKLKSLKHFQNYFHPFKVCSDGKSNYEECVYEEINIDIKDVFNKNYKKTGQNKNLNYLYFRNSYLKKDFVSLYMLNRFYKIIGTVDSGFKGKYLSLNMILMLKELGNIRDFTENEMYRSMIDKRIGSLSSTYEIYNQLRQNKYIKESGEKELGINGKYQFKFNVSDKGLDILKRIKKEIDLDYLLKLSKSYKSKESYESFKEKVLKI